MERSRDGSRQFPRERPRFEILEKGTPTGKPGPQVHWRYSPEMGGPKGASDAGDASEIQD